MSHKIRIVGGNPLKGKIQIRGAKNAALPLMTASLLTDKGLTLTNVPQLTDIQTMAELLAQHGVHINHKPDSYSYELKAADITNTTAPYDLVSKMRASILVLGPLLARCGEAKVSLPGGCAIGTRPVDIHLNGLRQLGAHIELAEGYIHASAPNGLIGAEISMPLVSVTATENLMMAASLAKGETKLINAAREPEIIDLAECLNSMGAKITGAGTDTITIEGVDRLHHATHNVLPDRIETGTYAMAAIITNGELELTHTSLSLISGVSSILGQAGADLQSIEDGIYIKSPLTPLLGVDVMTEPFPGFATDLQAQMMAVMTVCQGASMITETIFENRFMHVPELCRMGANITVHHSSALVRGTKHLSGAQVMATDLRASVCLVLAGLAANGETTLSRIYHLDRGYERLEEKLRNCGAIIERVPSAA
ncbi:MAG: UDP-N-acetylglucosamine 1-carboxyvinyltransferase [Alphaproteobacteria bacterium]|nr:UDP-N-acetylglucosamine 1-carboxyvinyltransferase [Alphaproteobacteria bacterium]